MFHSVTQRKQRKQTSDFHLEKVQFCSLRIFRNILHLAHCVAENVESLNNCGT